MARIRVQRGGVRVLAVLLAVALPSCGMLRNLRAGSDSGGSPDRAAKEQQQSPNQMVGEVVSVHSEQGFVLIKRYGSRSMPQDAVFNAIGPGGRTASIRPTGERSGRFYAADVTGGEPQRGDVVVARRLPRGSIEEVAPMPERPEPGERPLVPDF